MNLQFCKVKEYYATMTNCLTTSYYEVKVDELVGSPTIEVIEGEDRAFEGHKHIFIDLNVSTRNISVLYTRNNEIIISIIRN